MRATRQRRLRWGRLSLLAVVGMVVLGVCGTTTPTLITAPARPLVVLPKGAVVTQPSVTTTTKPCDATASLPPPTTMPTPGHMPAGSTMAQIQARGYLDVGVDDNTYLWGYRNPVTGTLSGFDIAMLQQVALAIFGSPGHIRYTIVPNIDRVPAVQKGQVDIVAETMTINCEREQSVDFSAVYYQAQQRILVPDNSTITGPQDLTNKRVCAPAGSTSLQNLYNLHEHIQLWAVNDETDCLVMLEQGQVDAISTDDAILEGLAAQDPNTELVGDPFSSEPYGMAISKSHTDFTSFVNGVLKEVEANGTWATIYDQYLQPATKMPAPAPPTPKLPVIVMTSLTVAEVDERIGSLRSVLDRTTERLVALDADVTRQLLEASTSLEGLTATRWAEASRRHADLWAGQFALEGVLTGLTELRGPRRSVSAAVLAELVGVLVGACVELPTSVESARVTLTGPAPAKRVTIDEALGAMSDDYELVAGLVAAVARVWEVTAERLTELARELAALEAGAAAAGMALPNQFRATGEALTQATAVAQHDPLALGAEEASELEARVRRLDVTVAEAAKDAAARREVREGALRTVRASHEAVAACRAQLQIWAEKVVVPDEAWATLERLATDLEEASLECDQLEALGTDVGGDRVVRRVESILEAVRALGATEARRFASRDELRGTLDAYRAKATAIGLAEDLVVDQIYTRAHDALYRAPCDLEEADRLVADYRRALRPAPEDTP